MKIINLVQGSQEWKDFRKFKIGASMASAIMGENPWETALQLWERMIADEEKPLTPAMKRGVELEPKARDWFNECYQTIEDQQMIPIVVQDDTYDWLIASLDGWDGRISLEIKCAGKDDHELANKGKIPKHYYAQLQHQMMVTNTNICNYFSFDGTEGVNVLCERDDKYMEKLFHAEKEFYHSLISFRPPKATARDEVEITDEMLVHNANNLAKLQEHIDLLQADYDDLRNQILAKIEHPRSRVGRIRIAKVIKKGNVDYGAIPELRNVNIEAYRKKPIESWRITINE